MQEGCVELINYGDAAVSAVPPGKTTLDMPRRTSPVARSAAAQRYPLRVTMDQLKRQAAAGALEHVRDGMRLGLGTGSTAKHFVELLGERVRAGLDVIGVPTSEATRADAVRCGIRLTTLDDIDRLDLTVDGADEIDPALNVIKGGGGALLREKIVATASDRMIVIADESKWVESLGRFPLPVEVIPFGLAATRRALAEAFAECGSFRPNGGPKGQGWPRFCHRWRPLDCRCPSWTNSRCARPGSIAERDTGRCRARIVHWPCRRGNACRFQGNSCC